MTGLEVKTLTWLVVLFCAVAVQGEEKHDYNIDLIKVQTNELSSNYLAKSSKFLDSLKDGVIVAEAVINVLREFPEAAVDIIGYQRNPANNLWMEKFRQSHPFCEFIEKNSYFVDNVYRDSNLPRACPITPGEYYIRNMIIDNTEFPKHLEEDSWRLDLDLVAKLTHEPIIKLSFYADIVAIPGAEEEEVEEEE